MRTASSFVIFQSQPSVVVLLLERHEQVPWLMGAGTVRAVLRLCREGLVPGAERVVKDPPTKRGGTTGDRCRLHHLHTF